MSSSRRASKKLFVANLSSKSKEKDLEDVFKEYGKVENLIIREGRSGDRFAFVEFETVEEAENANERVNGFELSGKALRVEFARPQRERGDDDRRDRGRDRGDRDDRDRGDRSTPMGGCYICKERNHQAKDCPRGNGKVGACYVCGSRGHRMKDCKGKGRGRSSSRSRSRSSSRKRRSSDRRKRSESGSRSRGNRSGGGRRNDRDDRKRSSRDRKKSRSRSNKRDKSPSSD